MCQRKHRRACEAMCVEVEKILKGLWIESWVVGAIYCIYMFAAGMIIFKIFTAILVDLHKDFRLASEQQVLIRQLFRVRHMFSHVIFHTLLVVGTRPWSLMREPWRWLQGNCHGEMYT